MASINACVSEVLSSHQKRKSLDIGNSLYQNKGLPQTASLQSLPGNGSNFLTVPQVPMRRTSSSSKLEQAARQGSLLLMRFETFKLNDYQQIIRKKNCWTSKEIFNNIAECPMQLTEPKWVMDCNYEKILLTIRPNWSLLKLLNAPKMGIRDRQVDLLLQ